MIGVIVVEVTRMAWFVERRVWLLWWEDGGSEAVVESDVGGGGLVVVEVIVVVVMVAWLALWLRWLL